MKIIQLPYHTNSETLFHRLSQLPHCVWLDSGRPGNTSERFDILSALPSRLLSNPNRDELVAQLQRPLAQYGNSADLPFSGGWIGCLNYDYRHGDFGLEAAAQTPAAWFAWFDWAIIVDHHLQQTSLFFLPACADSTVLRVQQALARPAAAQTFSCSSFRADEAKARYLDSIGQIKDYLLAGDCYQVNYTQRFSAKFAGSATAAYTCLRNAVPSPLSAYLDLGKTTILSISPERFIQLRGDNALAQPIKGTISRGSDQAEDQRLRQQLQDSEKNRAENVMIVDLLRNDFGQLCQPGSVLVPQLFAVQSFANVHHLVSTVTGTLPANVSHAEFLLACFPGGSITGAPKKRAMQIIAELESHSRQSYCGTIGYFSCNRKSDFNIAIRTLVQQNAHIHAWAGGGIVMDSVAEDEYEESLTKISRLLEALAAGGKGD